MVGFGKIHPEAYDAFKKREFLAAKGIDMTNESERAKFEAWYVENVFDLKRDPIGSKLCGDQWKSYQAGARNSVSTHAIKAYALDAALAAGRISQELYDESLSLAATFVPNAQSSGPVVAVSELEALVKKWATSKDWKTIDSAPRDGRTMILLLTPSRWPQVAWSNTWWIGGFSVECKPTHWMPLEPLPEAPC